MKKITSFALLLIFSVLFVVSCSQDEIEIAKQNVTVEELLLDENFIAISQNRYEEAGFIVNTIQNKGLSTSEIIPQLDALANASDENTIDKFNKIFKTNMGERITTNAQILSSNWEALDSKYSNITEELMTSAIAEHFEIQYMASSQDRRCGWRYYLCAGAAVSASGLCFTGCTAATVGIGAPACAAACTVVYAAALAVCVDNYC